MSSEESILSLIDIGANLAHRRFEEDFEAVLERSKEKQVRTIIITGTSLSSSKQAMNIAKRYPNFLYSTVGIHPHDAKHFNPKSTPYQLRMLIQQNPEQCKAIGECGLDFDRNFSTPQAQIDAFRCQLELACELKLPVFLHERSAHEKFIEILKEYREKLNDIVVHCFTGTESELLSYLELDCYIGITGWINDERRGIELRKLIPLIPLNRLMIETDAPFLTPRDIRPFPSRNEPSFLPYVLKAIAKARKQTVEEIAIATTENAKRFFRI